MGLEKSKEGGGDSIAVILSSNFVDVAADMS
jgi:hypothetical protein